MIKSGTNKENRCPGYVGISCVDGSCPVANQDEYEERGIPLVKTCEDCFMYRGCDDCGLKGTECCKKEEQNEQIDTSPRQRD